LRCEALQRPFSQGLGLSLGLYKPPLLVLILPMLVLARRWRTLAGFAVGSLVLAAVSLLAFGWQGCLAYVNHIITFSRIMQAPTTGFPDWKFVDLVHFLGPLFGSHTGLRRIVGIAVALVVLPFLARSWWTIDRSGPDQRMLTWAAT